MKTEVANIEYLDSELLEEVVKWYNHSHRNSTRSCELTIGDKSYHQLKVIDKSDLIPFGIYDVGSQIGYLEMNRNFRIKLLGWHKKYDRTIFKSNKHPKDELFFVTNNNEKEKSFKVRNATGINSDFGTIQIYLDELDMNLIEQKSNLTRLTPSMFQTHNQKRLNYSISNNLLFLYGTDLRYGKAYYEIELDSIFEIEIPKDDF
jgi:hypothetical protein